MDSNETLYGGDPKFLSEINKLCETLIGQILDHLKTLSKDEVRQKCQDQRDVTQLVVFMLMRRKCFLEWLVFAAEHTASRGSGLFLVRRPVGSRRPEQQQAEPAVRQPVEPQPQTRLLRDPDVGEFTCSRAALTFKPPLCGCLITNLAPGPDPGEHQTAGPAARHDPPDRRRPEAGPAVPHLSLSRGSRTHGPKDGKERHALLCFGKPFVYILSANICPHLLKCVTKPINENRNR